MGEGRVRTENREALRIEPKAAALLRTFSLLNSHFSILLSCTTMPQSRNRPRLYLLRHGQTEWSKSGQHTGRTDLPLTEQGLAAAKRLRAALADIPFSLVLCSPLQRARQTCEAAGMMEREELEPDLMEFDYGQYEGLTTPQIQEQVPGWNVFKNPSPGGETPAQVAERCDRVIARATGVEGNVALFAHGHLLRLLAARWLDQPPEFGQHLLLDTGTISILDHYHDEAPAIETWNASPGG